MNAIRYRPKSRRSYLAIRPWDVDWSMSRPINFLWSEPPTVRQAVSISGDLTLFEQSDADVGALNRDQFDQDSGVWKSEHYRGKYLLEFTYRVNDELGYEVGPTTIWPIAGDEWIVFDDDGQLVHILTDAQMRRRYESETHPTLAEIDRMAMQVFGRMTFIDGPIQINDRGWWLSAKDVEAEPNRSVRDRIRAILNARPIAPSDKAEPTPRQRSLPPGTVPPGGCWGASRPPAPDTAP